MSPTIGIISFIYISLMVISLLVTIIFVYYNWKNGLFGRLTSIALILISYGLFTSFNAAQGFFPILPHLARTGYLVLFIVTPLLFLTLKNGLFNKNLIINDYIHFIPSLVYFINFIPFFILSKSEKIQIIESDAFISFNEGWFLPPYFVIFMGIAQVIFYLVITTKKVLIPSISDPNFTKPKKKFLYFFYSYLFLLLLPPTVSFISGFIGIYATSPIILTYITSQIIFFLSLLSQPTLLHADLFQKKKNEEVEKVEDHFDQDFQIKPLVLKNDLSEESLNLIQQINSYFKKERPYLNFNFDQNALCQHLNLSNYQIRLILKNAYDSSFSDFVNHHRINYLLSKLDKEPKWRNYTMNTLANSIGFKSTNSLYLAFKKFVSTTPKEYIDLINLKNGSNS